jgi:predicted ester cyclase
MTPSSERATTPANRARQALERVCSGADPDGAAQYYSAGFVDRVNGMELRGLAGAARSVALYRRMLPDLSITVEGQVVEGDSVVSRFVVRGTSLGRRVELDGITISRFDGDLIVEDWSVTDTLGMFRQLGVVRSVLTVVRSIGPLLALRQTAHADAPQKCVARAST